MSLFPNLQPKTATHPLSAPVLGTCVLLASLLGGCTTNMQMAVPKDISAATDVFPATERSGWSGALADETFTLGPYKVVEVDRDWDSSQSDTISISKLDMKSGSTEGGYKFKFKTPSAQWLGKCSAQASENSVGMSGFKVLEKEAGLNCVCTNGKSEVSKVTVKAKNMDNYSGTLTTQGQSYRVASLKEREGSMAMGVSGYRVDGDQPVGAVEVLKPGRIWLGRDLEPTQRAGLACSFVGLMLYMPAE